jgi:SOS response regulatory protein OraA/RecX
MLILHRVSSLRLYFIPSLLHSLLVFTSTKKVDTEQELYDIALRALMRRPHSIKEMQRLLDRRASHKLLAQVVLARMKENGQLDDTRYAQQFTRQRTEIRRQGKFKITRDLRARGVSDADIQSAVESSTDDESQRLATASNANSNSPVAKSPTKKSPASTAASSPPASPPTPSAAN